MKIRKQKNTFLGGMMTIRSCSILMYILGCIFAVVFAFFLFGKMMQIDLKDAEFCPEMFQSI
jgi:hypothetical protein